MLTARMFSSFLKFNSKEYPSMGGKVQYFNGLTALKPNSDFDPKWGEISVDVVVIYAFLALKGVNYPVGQWGG